MNIQTLIATGATEQALEEFCKVSNDGILLLSRYNAGKNQFNMGMIEFGEWSRIQNQINYAVLEIVNSLPKQTIQTEVEMKITINFTSVITFKESISNMRVDKLVEVVTQEFKGKPAMEAWLPLKQDYDSYEMLGKAFSPDYLETLKTKLVDIYNEYWVNAKSKENGKIKEVVKMIYNSLQADLSKTMVEEALINFLIFFHENPCFHGIPVIEGFQESLKSGKMIVFEQHRPESYKEELEKIRKELIAISNRILMSVEG